MQDPKANHGKGLLSEIVVREVKEELRNAYYKDV